VYLLISRFSVVSGDMSGICTLCMLSFPVVGSVDKHNF
jgi:hypothetical protein